MAVCDAALGVRGVDLRQSNDLHAAVLSLVGSRVTAPRVYRHIVAAAEVSGEFLYRSFDAADGRGYPA